MLGAPVFRTALFGPWSGNALWTAARAVPSFDLPFADSKSLVDAITGRQLVTFARAGSGTYVDSAGVLQTAATDVPRFDHNPLTGESLGLLVEEQRTNSIRNNTMVGAVAGTPGTVPTNWNDLPTSNGLSRQIVGIGTQLGITYIDIRYSGTTTAAASTVTQPEPSANVVAATGQSWTASSWLSLVGGSTSGLTVVQRVTGRSSVGGFLENTDTSVSLTGTLTRYAASIALANALTARVSCDIVFSYASGAAIDFTLRIGLPQLEQGAFATSVIPTSTAAATRSADVASITGANFSSWYRQDEGTVFAEALTQEYTVTTFPRVFSIDDGGAASSFIALVRGSNTRRWDYSVFANGTGQAVGLNNGISPSAGAVCRGAVIYRANDFTGATQGVLMNADTSGSVPTVNALGIGMQSNATLQFNGHIRRLAYWPQALPGQLQAITQP